MSERERERVSERDRDYPYWQISEKTEKVVWRVVLISGISERI